MEITTFVHNARDRAFAIGTYSSYRATLSRQILTLRRRLGRSTPRNAKYASTKRREITGADVSSNVEFVHLLLAQAERAWAHALSMKTAHVEDPTPRSSTKRHVTSRLHRAVKYAQQLVDLLHEAGNSEDAHLLEAEAYKASLAGAEAFESATTSKASSSAAAATATSSGSGGKGKGKGKREVKWKQCLEHFSEAHVIYAALLTSTGREVFKEMLAGEVDQSIRYAAYQSALPRTISTSTVAKRYFPSARAPQVKQMIEKLDASALSEEATTTTATVTATTAATATTATAKIPTTMNWRGRTAQISDAAIGQAAAATITAAEQLTVFLSSSSSSASSTTTTTTKPKRTATAAAYDPVLTAAQETVDCVRRAIAELSKEGTPESDPRMQDLRVCDLAANYDLISWRVGRNRVLISSSTSGGGDNNAAKEDDDGSAFTTTCASSLGGATASAPSPAATTSSASSQQQQQRKGKGKAKGKRAQVESRGHALARLKERVVLFDAIKQSLEFLPLLPGAGRDTAFLADLQARSAYFAALRCLNVAFSHALLAQHREALALFHRAHSHVASVKLDSSSSSSSYSSPSSSPAAATTGNVKVKPPTLEISPTQLEQLRARLRAYTVRQHGLVALQQYASLTPPPPSSSPLSSSSKNKAGAGAAAGQEYSEDVYLIDRLDRWTSAAHIRNDKLVNYPPKLRPVPVKPIFLDLAWNHIKYPTTGAAAGASIGAGKGSVAGNGLSGTVESVAAGAKNAAAAVVEAAATAANTTTSAQSKQQQQQQPQKKKGWFGFGGS